MTDYPLYGDGVHDDTSAIQARLDTGVTLCHLPPPKAFYQISRTLVMHSNQELRMDRWSEIRLAPKSNCIMLTNDNYEQGNCRIAVTGGIWNGNNTWQAPNPQMVTINGGLSGDGIRRMPMPEDWPLDPVTGTRRPYEPVPWHPARYFGETMRFINVHGFAMCGVTLKNPVTYAVHSAKMTDFTFEDIAFDFNEGNPSPNNMDGLHFDGGCRFGRITNVRGACYDDMLAFNAEDGIAESPFMGPISDIEVDGVYAERCHSCARFLSNGSPISNISIRNVFGSFYRYAFGFTHFFPNRPKAGVFDALSFENLHISKALPLESDWNRCPDWGLFWGEGNGKMGAMRVLGLKRVETTTGTPSFDFEKNFAIEQLCIEQCITENRLKAPLCFIRNAGKIGKLILAGNIIRDCGETGPATELDNTGTIAQIVRY
ncbi:MAG: hypothetical protein IKS20_04670 [Victivallales bacterium]|nr:hypothetical protein [Victivallales bacterium]